MGSPWNPSGGGGAAVWGSITGTLGSQADLAAALAAKAAAANSALTGTTSLPTSAISYPINAVNQGTKKFTLTGDAQLDIAVGQVIGISGSTGNDGYYTVTNIAYSAPNTVVTVNEAIPSAVADGDVDGLYTPVTVVDGQLHFAAPNQLGGFAYLYADQNGTLIYRLNFGGNPQVPALVLGAGGGLTVEGFVKSSSNTGFTGDSGSGGSTGLVPAPAAGDAAAGKYLKADGTWATAGGLTVLGGLLNGNQAFTTTTLTNIAALSITLTAGKIYRIIGAMHFSNSTSNAAGFKFDLGGGTVVLSTGSSLLGMYFNNTAGTQTTSAWFTYFGPGESTTVSNTANTNDSNKTLFKFDGIIKVSIGGTLIPRMAQNTATGTNVLQGSPGPTYLFAIPLN